MMLTLVVTVMMMAELKAVVAAVMETVMVVATLVIKTPCQEGYLKKGKGREKRGGDNEKAD